MKKLMKNFVLTALSISILISQVHFLKIEATNKLFSSYELETSQTRVDEHKEDIFQFLKSKYTENSDKKLRLIAQTTKDANILERKLREISSVSIKYAYSEIFKGFSFEIAEKDLDKLYFINEISFIQETQVFTKQMFTTGEIVKVLPKLENYPHDGRGMVVAIVDSGIDTKHKDLRLDADVVPKITEISESVEGEYTKKVPHGYNYVHGNNKLIDETEYPHGMHIAGIIGANATDDEVANKTGIDGIAPNAQLLMYRVFSDRKDTQVAVIDDTVYAAIEDAIKHKADVISLSIGSYGTGKKGDAFYKAVEKAKQNGIVIVASMGNAGASSSSTSYDKYTNNKLTQRDLATTVSVAANVDVIGVGSTRNKYQINHKIRLNNQEFYYVPVSYSQFENGEYEIVNALQARDEDLRAINIAGKVAIISRSLESPKVQFDRLRAKGAIGVISYNTNNGRNRDFYDTEMQQILEENVAQDLWGLTVSHNDGLKILDLIKQTPRLIFNNLGVQYSLLSEENEVSGFSSWGTTLDLELKPEIIAPGERIYSTLNHNRYGIMSGTSMSTPVVGGAAAILLPRFREMNRPEGIDIVDFTKIMMMNTATPVFDTTGYENSPRQQGAGMLNIQAAFANNVLITHNQKGSVNLKEIGDITKFTVKVENLGQDTETFTIRTSEVLTSGDIEVVKASGETVSEIHAVKSLGSSLSKDRREFSLAGGEKVEINFELRASSVSDEFVEGFIYFDSATNPNLVLPYFAYKGDWGKDDIIDPVSWSNKSKTKLTTLMSSSKLQTKNKYTILGLAEFDNPDSEIFENNIAITSTVSDNILGSALLRLAVMRDLNDFQLDVVKEKSENARSLRTIQNGNFLEKFRYVDFFENEFYNKEYLSPEKDLIWDARLYNPKTGELEAAEEGQYFLRLRVRNDEVKNYQYTYFPLKIDNQLPQVQVHKEGDTYIIDTNDNNGIWFVRGEFNDVTFEAEKLTPTRYRVANLDVDKFKENKLKLTVVDIAGNFVKYETVVEKPLALFQNLDDVKNKKRSTTLVALVDETVQSIEVNKDEFNFPVTLANNRAEVDLSTLPDGRHTLNFVLKGSDSTELHRGTLTFTRDVTKPEVVYDELKYKDDDEFEGILDTEEGYATIKGRVTDNLTPSDKIKIYYYLKENRYKPEEKKLLYPNSDGTFEFRVYVSDFKESVVVDFVDEANRKESRTFILKEEEEVEHIEAPFVVHELKTNIFLKEESLGHNLEQNDDGTFAYKLKVTSSEEGYKIRLNDEEIQEFPEDEDTLTLNFTLNEGANIIRLRGYNEDEELIYERRINYFVDINFPRYEIPNFRPMPRLETESDTSVEGTVYFKSDEVDFSGYAEDDGLSWSLFINDDIVKRGKAWREFGGNRESFAYTVHLRDGEILKFRLVDFFGNEEDGHYKKYRVVLDEEKPVITHNLVDTYKKQANFTTAFSDNTGILETEVLVDNQAYVNDSLINEVGEHRVKLRALDYAGNETVLNKTIAIIDDIAYELSAEEVKENDVDKLDKWLNFGFGTKGDIIEKNIKGEQITIKVLFYNDLGEEKIDTFTLKYIRNREKLIEFISIEDYLSKLVNWGKADNKKEYTSRNEQLTKHAILKYEVKQRNLKNTSTPKKLEDKLKKEAVRHSYLSSDGLLKLVVKTEKEELKLVYDLLEDGDTASLKFTLKDGAEDYKFGDTFDFYFKKTDKKIKEFVLKTEFSERKLIHQDSGDFFVLHLDELGEIKIIYDKEVENKEKEIDTPSNSLTEEMRKEDMSKKEMQTTSTSSKIVVYLLLALGGLFILLLGLLFFLRKKHK